MERLRKEPQEVLERNVLPSGTSNLEPVANTITVKSSKVHIAMSTLSSPAIKPHAFANSMIMYPPGDTPVAKRPPPSQRMPSSKHEGMMEAEIK